MSGKGKHTCDSFFGSSTANFGNVEHKREALAEYALAMYLFLAAILRCAPQGSIAGGKRGCLSLTFIAFLPYSAGGSPDDTRQLQVPAGNLFQGGRARMIARMEEDFGNLLLMTCIAADCGIGSLLVPHTIS
ncbi:hypothetical protein J7T55_006694 [Diaporthe amygdali]|uniref:uncharacterized protein n=1 Tax=Phomopsis amygdali TaxID=1214568 RepID=UPI0022FEEDA6|nr:uncharacterized protein J7T55_006694 [Diaporthe amygdali]KAJ0125348.1 hypothetical protein J7T55_006694 [Diaporthe amygdali]